eukprot:scaffold56135_cov28-Tisochrysis_lutea.AAC.6
MCRAAISAVAVVHPMPEWAICRWQWARLYLAEPICQLSPGAIIESAARAPTHAPGRLAAPSRAAHPSR